MLFCNAVLLKQYFVRLRISQSLNEKPLVYHSVYSNNELSDVFTSLSLFVYLSDIAMNISSSQLYGEVSDHI